MHRNVYTTDTLKLLLHVSTFRDDGTQDVPKHVFRRRFCASVLYISQWM